MHRHRTTNRKVRYLTVEELGRLQEVWPWVADPLESLPLDTRTFNCLRNEEIAFLGELVQYTQWELLRLRNFGRKSLGLVKSVLAERGLQPGIGLSDDYSELLVLPRDALAGALQPPAVISAPRSPTEELLHADVLPTTPWHECLDVKMGTAHVLLLSGLERVGDVLEQVRDARLSAATMSPEWFEDLLEALGKLGIGRAPSGPLVAADLPRSIPALCELALTHLSERHAAVLIRRYLFGETLQDIAEEWLVTPERIRQLRAVATKRIQWPVRQCITDRTRQLAEALEKEGFLPRDRVFELAECRDMRYVRMALAIIGIPNTRIDRQGALCLMKRSSARPAT